VSLHTCQVGHTSHELVKLHIHLDHNRKIPDFPAFRDQYQCSFDFFAYNYDLYKDTVGYCTGRDSLCHALITQGIWEGFETLLTLGILLENKGSGKVFLDFGANLGWYSMLALINGFSVEAFEADSENLQTLMKNATLNGKADCVQGHLCWVDENYVYPGTEDVLLLKTDMEGLDPYAISACKQLFEKGKVDYVFAEISPILKPGNWFPDMVEQMVYYGFSVFQIPNKGFEHMVEFENNPLNTVVKYCELNSGTRYEYVKSLRQENFLFVK